MLDDPIAQFNPADVTDVIQKHHPQASFPSVAEIASKLAVQRGDDERILDSQHQSKCTLTKFEKARAIGLRKKQLDEGAEPYIATDLTDSYLIACEELREKLIPFIVRRYLPNRSEYFRLSDLEDVNF